MVSSLGCPVLKPGRFQVWAQHIYRINNNNNNKAKKENAVYNQDQDHQKGKNGREVVRNLSVNHNLVHLTIMLKNTINSRKVDHNLQRKVLKDAANSGKVDYDLLKDTTNSGKVDHDLQRKVLKDASNSRKVNLDLVHLTMMLKMQPTQEK